MNGFMKTALFPAVIVLRAWRRVMRHPLIVTRMLFSYDQRRFERYAGGFHPESRSASLARIIMAYHVIEKGITMPRRHLDFGHSAVLNLISLVEDFERRFGADEPQLKHAVGCVKEYLSIHKTEHFDMSKDRDYWDSVEDFCSAHVEVPCACQIKVSRKDFFAHNEDPFPAFAASRRTSRHYEGVVELDRIRAAVALAMTAPSACNRQFVKVYCVSNHKMRDGILALQNGNRGFGSDADKLLIVAADLCGNRWAEERNDLFTNAGIFLMNLSYALHYNKIAHCILNWSVSPGQDLQMRTMLRFPNTETVVALVACGNAPETFEVAASPRKDIEDVFREIT